MGQMRCTRKRSRRGRRRDKGSWKGLKKGIKDTWRGGEVDVALSSGWGSSLCAPIDSVSPVLQLFVLCSVLKGKYFCFLSFYRFVI